MAELLVAQVLWLLGQDEQLLRPRVGRLRAAIVAGAFVDVLDSGAAGWAGTDEEPQVRVTGVSPSDPLSREWAARLAEAAPSQPIRVIHAINSLGSGMWDAVGADLAHRGLATDVRRPVRRWLPPRHRPDRDATHRARTHLRNVIHGTEPATPRDHGVLAVAWCADLAEHVLSQTAFTDPTVVAPTRTFLEDSALVRRINDAVSYLVSMAPRIGITTSWPGTGP